MDQTVVIIYHKKTVFEEQNKCKTFSVLITKNVKKIDKNKEKITKTISYKKQFVDSTIFMASSL